MHSSTNGIDWIRTLDGRVLGITLGQADRVEHRTGIAGILAAFAVPAREGRQSAEDYRVRKVPASLRFLDYKEGPRSKSIRPYPAAVLALMDGHLFKDDVFRTDPGSLNSTVADDFYAEWDESAFRLFVRGPENVRLLGQLYRAFRRQDVAVGIPGDGSTPSFVMLSALSGAERQAFDTESLEEETAAA